MNNRTSWAYLYRHDGGTYIGCRAQGKYTDCMEDDLWKVDCPECEFNLTLKEWEEKYGSKRVR